MVTRRNRKCYCYGGFGGPVSCFFLITITTSILAAKTGNYEISDASNCRCNPVMALENIHVSSHCANIASNHFHINKSLLKIKGKTNLAYVMSVLILTLSGDIETNPGPIKYPCSVCNKRVTWKCKALQCDECDLWAHIRCVNISPITYDNLAESSALWMCPLCGIPNFTPSLLGSSLDPDLMEQPNHGNSSSASLPEDIGEPLFTSSPVRTRPHNKHQNIGKNLKILNVNCQSISAHRGEFQNLILSTDPDIIIATETWLTPAISNSECFPTDLYQVERKDRTRGRGGGILIACKTSLSMTREIDLETECELMWCKLNLRQSKSLYIGAFYRPHESDERSIDLLEMSLARLRHIKYNIILGGDFNFPSWQWTSKGNQIKTPCKFPSLYEKFNNIIDDFSLTQTVHEPTRNDNILDLFFTNQPGRISKCGINPGISDHDCPLLEMDLEPIKHRQKPRTIYLYSKTDWTSFNQYIRATTQANPDIGGEDVNTQWNFLKSIIDEGTKKFIPKKISRKRNKLPYISREIRSLIRKRNRIYQHMKEAWKEISNHNRARKLKEKHQQLNRDIQKKIRHAYWKYVEDIITPLENEARTSQKRFWTYIKHMKNDNSTVGVLKENGTNHTEAKGKADALNRQFQKVFTRETPIPLEERNTAQLYPDAEPLTITAPGVQKLLEQLKPNKSPGPDSIQPIVLKELAPSITPLLTEVFRCSLRTGVVPDDWKKANVTPAFKKGDKSKPSNYRPISLTCIACKVMEHIVTSHVMRHADKYNILYKNQHGFRSKLSCETQLIEFIDDVINNMNSKSQTDVLIMDFSKAFDKVGHDRLLLKLHRYGIKDSLNMWIGAFLHGRTQQVVLEGEYSYVGDVISGVPQGSVLGPCLFLFFINDMADNIKSPLRLFADDTIAYLAIKSEEDSKKLQNDLDRLGKWEKLWQMEFHPEKCQVLRITRNRKNIVRANYHLHGHKLELVDKAKYLGITITSDLRWNDHINLITNRANSSLAFIKRNIRIPCPRIKAIAYKSLVRPHVEYASAVWDPFTAKNIDKIEAIQTRAARWALNKYRYGPNTTPVNQMISELEWPSLCTRRKENRLTCLYKIKKGIVRISPPPYIQPPTHQHNTRNKKAHTIAIPDSLTNYHQNSFFPRTVRDWNQLSPSITEAPSLEIFKSKLHK